MYSGHMDERDVSPSRGRPDLLDPHHRRMGVLLHPSSLPGPDGIGDLGPEARRFVDWLASAGASVWQVLPLCPPGGPADDVPYASWAALAGNPQLLSVDDLASHGLVDARLVAERPQQAEGWADIASAVSAKAPALRQAEQRLRDGHPWGAELEAFRAHSPWAIEAARFAARARAAGTRNWLDWPPLLASRRPDELAKVDEALRASLDATLVRLFLFERQWAALRRYAHERGVAILGDLPVYVLHGSADVWANPKGWQLDDQGRPLAVAGAPPDVFSADGQVWGLPLYDWEEQARDDYGWWRARMQRALTHFDGVRLDHFRAFSAYWSIPPGASSATTGRWRPGPGRALFDAVSRHLGPLPLCAEDLGHIDDEVRRLLADLDLPGMKILHYAFGEDADNPYLPHNLPTRSIVYPGNHDNDTTVGWWSKLSAAARTHVQHYLGRHGDDIAWDLIRVALASASQLAVVQMQDVLSLGSDARTNDPESYSRSNAELRNWRWRLRPDQVTPFAADRLRHLAGLYGRIMEA